MWDWKKVTTAYNKVANSEFVNQSLQSLQDAKAKVDTAFEEAMKQNAAQLPQGSSTSSSSSTAARYHGDQLTVAPAFDSDFPVLGPSPAPPSARQECSPRREVPKAREARRSGEPTTQQNASKGLFDDDEFDVFMLGEGDTSHAAQSSDLTSAPHPKHDEASLVKDSSLSPDALRRPSPSSISSNVQDILNTTGSWNGGGSSGVQTAAASAADEPSSGGHLVSNDLPSGSERESSQPSSATPITVEALVESGKDVEGHRHHTESPQLALAAREAPTAMTTSSAHLEDQAVAPAALSGSEGSTGTMPQTTERGAEVVQEGTPLPGEPASPLNEDNTSLSNGSKTELKPNNEPSEAELELSDEQIVPSSQEPLLQFQPVDAYTASTDALVSVETIQAPRPTEPSADQVSSENAGPDDTATLPSGTPSGELPASADESFTPPEVPALGGPSDIEDADGDQRGTAAGDEPAESCDAQSQSLHAMSHKESTVYEIAGPTSEAQATSGGSIPSEPESRPKDVASSEDDMESGVEPTDGDADTEEAPKEIGEDLTGRLNAEATDATALSEIDDRSPGLSGVNEIPSDSHIGVSEGGEAAIDTDSGSGFAQRSVRSDSQCRASQNEELPGLVAKSQSPSRRRDTSAMSDSGDKLNSERDEEVRSQGVDDSGAEGTDLSPRDMSEGEDNDASAAAESSEGGSRGALETATTAVDVGDESCPATQADPELLITAAEGATSVAARGSCPEQTSTSEQEGASGIAGPQQSEDEMREATAGHGDTSGTGKCAYVGEAPSEILEGIDIPELPGSAAAAAGPTQEYSASAPAVEGEDVEYDDLGPVGRRLMSMEGFIDTVRDRAGSTFSSRARSSSDTGREQAKMTGPREDEPSVLEDLTSNLLEDSKGSGEDVEHIVLGEGSPAVVDANEGEDAGHSSTGESRSGEEHEVDLVGLESSEGRDALINSLRDEVEELKSRLRSREEQLEAHAKTMQMILEEGNKAEVNSQAFRDLESMFYATTEELSDVKAVAATREKHILKLQEDVRVQSQEAEDAREETQRILEEGKKLAQRLANLEQKQKSRLQQLEAAKKEKEKLRAELDNAQQKFKDLGDASAESAALREQMQKDRQKMKAHLASVVAEKNKAEGDLAAAKEKINQYQREKEDLLSGQKLTESELERASAELSATEKELLSSQRQSAEEIDRLQTELEETQRALTKSQSGSESGTYGTLTSGEQRAVDAEAERDSLQVELGNTRRELSDARGKLESSKDEASELRKEISSLKVEVEKLKAVQADKDEDAARLSHALEEVSRLQGQLRQSEARVSEVAGKLRSSETEKRTTVEEARTAKLRVEELEEQLKAAQKGLQEAQSKTQQQPGKHPLSESTSVEPSFTRNTASSSSYAPRGGLELERHCKELERKFEVSLQALGQLQEELDESKEVAAMYKSMLRSQVEDDTASTSRRHQP